MLVPKRFGIDKFHCNYNHVWIYGHERYNTREVTLVICKAYYLSKNESDIYV